MILPLVVAWTMRPGEDGRDLHLASVSMQRAGRRLMLFDWFLAFAIGRDKDARLIRYRDETIYDVASREGRHFMFFIRGNDFFLASDAGTAEQAVDRLSAPPGEPVRPGPLSELMAEIDSSHVLRAAVGNEGGELERVAGAVYATLGGVPAPPDPAWGRARAATLGGTIGPDGSLDGVLELIGPAGAATWSEAQATALVEQLRLLAGEGLPLEVELALHGVPQGDRARVAFHIPDFGAVLARWVEHGLELVPRSVKVEVETPQGS